MLSRKWAAFMQTDVVMRWMCYRLMVDYKLYSPLKLTAGVTWKSMFMELFNIRHIWSGDDSSRQSGHDPDRKSERAKINVYARFRPIDNSQHVEDTKEITLPLHQRLALIKMSCKLKSNRAALHVMKEEGTWFGKKWQQTLKENISSVDNKVKVPPKATSKPLVADIQSVDEGCGRVVIMTPDVGLREFCFDGVFSHKSNQKRVYDTVACRLVSDVLNGFNSTAIMYGQTGSGKTFTMFGEGDERSSSKFVKEGHGIVYRACEDVLTAVQSRKSLGIISEVAVSYVEVYGDTVTDLLKRGRRCGQSKVASQQYVLSGAAEQEVSSMGDISHLLSVGDEQKRRAATAMNDRSTRAHSIFILTLKQKNVHSEVSMTSKLFLADLGGSEQVKKSQVAPGQSRTKYNVEGGVVEDVDQLSVNEASLATFSTGFEMGERMREAVYINLGLLALKKCIEALNNNLPYVPYQDSKLTMLLSAGLASGRISVVVCGNSNPSHITETIATLRFGERCAQIEMEVRNNATVLEGVLAQIDSDISDLEAQIVAKERWEVVEERRKDELAEEGTVEAAVGGVERRVVTVLTGAEEERARLDELIKKRAELTGSEIVAKAYKSNVVGFGAKYGKKYTYGSKYDAEADLKSENVRFLEKTAMEKVPVVVRSRGKEWKMGKELESDSKELERKAKTAKRNKLVYSGISS